MKLSKSVQKEFMTVTTFSKFVAMILFVVLPFLGFFFGVQYQQLVNQNQQLIDTYKWDSYKSDNLPLESTLAKFSGNLPCADCESIQTELTLKGDSKTMAPRTFALVQTYQGKSDSSITIVGNWNIIHGTKKDPYAIVYQLNPDAGSSVMYFMKVNDQTLIMLDETMNQIKSKLNYALVKEQ